MPYPNFAGKHAHDALLEPSTFVRYWTAQGLLPESYTAPIGVVVLYQQRLFDAVIRVALRPTASGHRSSATAGWRTA